MIKKMTLAALLLASCSVAVAATPADKGAYVGGGFGTTSFDDDGGFGGLNFDDSDSGFGIFGGYKFFKHLAVEGRYTDFGTFSIEGIPFDATGISIHAVGMLPLGDGSWELFGQLGLGTVEVEIVGESDSENVGSAGIGVRYNFSEQLSFALQTDTYAYEDTSFGMSFDVSVTQTALTMKYNF